MPTISLTDFVDFVIQSGTPKVTKVNEIKKRPKYTPQIDYWRPLRKGLHNYHSKGLNDKSLLEDEIGHIHPKKLARYTTAIFGYKKFLGKKQITWFNPPKAEWTHGALSVRVNPELGLSIGGIPYVTKLYFKDESPTTNRVEVIFTLMALALADDAPDGALMSIINVEKGKQLLSKKANPAIQVLLEAEAASFVYMWNKA